MDYSTLLTDDQKKSILESRIAQFATEAFQHEMNLRVAKSLKNDEGVDNAEKALAILETAINEHKTELDAIK
jgi:hypothetical protein